MFWSQFFGDSKEMPPDQHFFGSVMDANLMFLSSVMGSSLKSPIDIDLDQVFLFRMGMRILMELTFIHRIFTRTAEFQPFLHTVQNRVLLPWVHLEQLRVVEV